VGAEILVTYRPNVVYLAGDLSGSATFRIAARKVLTFGTGISTG
jgi:hypothetical protein